MTQHWRLKRLYHKTRGKSKSYLVWKAIDIFRKRMRKFTHSFEAQRYSEDGIFRMLAESPHATLREHFLERGAPRFFVSQSEISELLSYLQKTDPQYKQRYIAKAEKICNHHLYILSHGQMNLGEKIDWQRDYRSGLRWENQYAFDYDVMDPERPTDVRTVWELNRLHFLVDLGKAYRLSGNEKYVLKLMELVTDWDIHNPYAHSINWGCAMEPAVRVVNLIWAMEFFLPSENLSDHFLSKLVRILLQHGDFVRKNLEFADVRSNHYVSNLAGLIFLGVYLQEIKYAKNWLDFVVPVFEKEIHHQAFPDGSTHEGSIPYHRLTTELFLVPTLLLRKNDRVLANSFWGRLEKMLEFVQAYTQPNGTAPMFGDSDNGRLQILGEQSVNDHRYLLSIGSVLFQRPDFKFSSGEHLWEEAIWLLGPQGIKNFRNIPTKITIPPLQVFPDSGYFFLRASDCYVAIDCGEAGGLGRGGHGHNDGLSFVMSLGQEQVVVDYGTPRYTDNAIKRIKAISIGQHNITTVDDAELAQFKKYGIVTPTKFQCHQLSWIEDDTVIQFIGKRTGKLSPGEEITILREFVLHKKYPKLSINEQIQGSHPHTVYSRFLLSPGSIAEKNDRTTIRIILPSDREILVKSSEQSGEWHIETSSCYPSYGREIATQRVVWQCKMLLPATLSFTFEWDIQRP